MNRVCTGVRSRFPSLNAAVFLVAALAYAPVPARAADNSDCFGCHDDTSLTSAKGRKVGVSEKVFAASAHKDAKCTGCHEQEGDFGTAPHFAVYRKVICSRCHEKASDSFAGSFHGAAQATQTPNAPTCISCHAVTGDAHRIMAITPGSAEASCRRCHQGETKAYDGGVHAAAAAKGKLSPGCVGCHETHTKALPPSSGAVNLLCEKCHRGAMRQVEQGAHKNAKTDLPGKLSCVSCHDKHATHKPVESGQALAACQGCHRDYSQHFAGSVHESLFASGKMSCLTCHRTHQVKDATETENLGCGSCHAAVEAKYRNTAHRMARLHGNVIAATCGGCHGGHKVLRADDPESAVNHRNIPKTCGRCHTGVAVITADFVRLPISLPRYAESVHGEGWKSGKLTAVCTDCHGSHDLQSSAVSTSTIAKPNIAHTCSKCHQKQADEYAKSVHGRAVAHGIVDSPTCTNCHEEHLIRKHGDPKSRTSPENVAAQTCAKCHQDPEMAAKYGLPPEVIESFEDSYHGWAQKRGGRKAAVCIDCHTTHSIGSALDATSSIHKSNVVATCAKCHPDANPAFAASYTHVLARGKKLIHDYVRLVYIWLIALVLGGMLLHNLVIYADDLRTAYRQQRSEKAIRRLTRSELLQHLVLLVTFFALGFSGFALRFPDSFWVRALMALGITEENRRLFHRTMAVLLIAASFFHVYYILLTRRGRTLAWAMVPRLSDVAEARANVAYYLGLGREKPMFSMFDYTQKAEYWALIWGTLVMTATGFILWFPAFATAYMPPWAVRVSEVIHYYEAILAVSAIFIWHFFFVIFKTGMYPMSFTWVTGRMPMHEWRSHHGRAEVDTGPAEVLPGEESGGESGPPVAGH